MLCMSFAIAKFTIALALPDQAETSVLYANLKTHFTSQLSGS
jgi:hypothetical protein